MGWKGLRVKRGFHEPTNVTDERQKQPTCGSLKNKFGWCHRFDKSAN